MNKRNLSTVVASIISVGLLSACATSQPQHFDDEPTFNDPAATGAEAPATESDSADQAPDLSDPQQFIDFVKEHQSLPQDYTADKLAELAGAFGVDMDVDKLSQAGDKFCSAEQTKKYVQSINQQFADVDALRDSGDDYAAKALDGLDIPALDKEIAEFVELVGADPKIMEDLSEERGVALYGLLDIAGINSCATDFDDTQLRGAQNLIAFGSEEKEFKPLL